MAPSSLAPPGRPPTILCVDDESAALLLRKTLLEGAGYRVLTALNASGALKILGSKKVDLVVSDHLLPGLSGTAMALQIKRERPGIPILLLSGVTDVPDGIEHTFKFVSKTDGPDKLLEAVAELLRYRRVRLRRGAFCAEIACDTFKTPAVWHWVVQRVGSPEVILWSQAPSKAEALAAAKQELDSLNRAQRPH